MLVSFYRLFFAAQLDRLASGHCRPTSFIVIPMRIFAFLA